MLAMSGKQIQKRDVNPSVALPEEATRRNILVASRAQAVSRNRFVSSFGGAAKRLLGWRLLRSTRVLLTVAFVMLCAVCGSAEEPAALPEEPLSASRLVVSTSDGTPRGFDELLGADGRAVCFAFLHPRCLLSQEYAPVLEKLAREFNDRGIRFVGVICENDAPLETDDYRTKFRITFPLHLDTSFTLAEALGATVTPEVLLVDRERKVRYAGRIDDRYKVRGVITLGDADPELANAIRDLLANREIREPRTQPVGCPLDRPERPGVSTDTANTHAPTFFRDILPFLHANCQKCHSPNQAGPFNLLTYEDAVDWLEVAIDEIEARRMPPGQMESELDYQNTKPPSAADLAMLRQWVAADKPKGDPADTPPLPPLPDYSVFQEDLGPPDIVLEQPEPTQLGAHGNDLYRNIVFPLNRKEDLQVRAIQFLPGNRHVVHHALTGHLPRESAEEAVRNHGGREGFGHPDDRGGGFQDPHGIGFRVPPVRDDGQPRAAFLTGFVPGVRATASPPDAAMVIPAGCDISVQTHYVRAGKLETDSSRVGIWLAKQPPSKGMNMIYISGDFAVVPKGISDFRVRGSYTLPQDADFVGVVPHAHQLARWIEIKAHLPGEPEPLLVLRVPQWDYNWQSPYNLKQPRRFPAGTRFEAECSYDNSSANPRNPSDPPEHVWHNETMNDEMLLPMFTFSSDRPLDNKGQTFGKFVSWIARSRLLRRLVDHRYKYIADPQGNVLLSPDYDPDDHRY
jgi:thiol-disulfide isomerase/thioredoxin